MLPYQLKLRDLEKALIKECKTLNKSKNRPRSQNSINEKRAKFYDIILEYKHTISKLEFKLPIEEWNNEVAKYNNLKITRDNANKILDETKVLPPATFKAAVRAIIRAIVRATRPPYQHPQQQIYYAQTNPPNMQQQQLQIQQQPPQQQQVQQQQLQPIQMQPFSQTQPNVLGSNFLGRQLGQHIQ